MKKTTSYLLALLSILTFFTTSCSTEDPLADCKADPTCEYFRCLIDGKEWRPDCESDFLGCDAVDVQYYRDGGGLSINTFNTKSNNGFRFTIKNIVKEDTKYLYGINNQSFTWYNESIDSVLIKYLSGIDSTNYIFFTKIDTINFLLEGTFEFTGVNEMGQIKEITKGEFRQHYRF